MGQDADMTDSLRDAVRRAMDERVSLHIRGSRSKDALLPALDDATSGVQGRVLGLSGHCGIVDYRPEELVIKARAGTPLALIEQTLAEHRQRLPFDPPRFQGRGTLGGAVASGLPGPGRPGSGSVRDAVLGVDMLNGLGEVLSFGGEVMKNVAGYDVSRLQAGAFGTLGVLLAIAVRVAPVPALERTLMQSLEPADALARCRAWARLPYPISATAYLDGQLHVRLSGAAPAVEEAARRLGGESGDDGFWQGLRDHELAFLRDEGPLWRCILPPAAPAPLDACLWTWSGGLRWWRTDLEPNAVRDAVGTWGGSAQPFDHRFASARLGGITAAQADYQRRIRLAFDPQSLFNPDLGFHHAD
jgi:glycolate oxidase FAD binding subunit